MHHIKNVRSFSEDVSKATGGELNVVVHSGASLVKYPEVHRAVRSGQVPIGEMFMGLLGATRTSWIIIYIIAGASFLNLAMGFTGIQCILAEQIASLGLSPVVLTT